MSEREPRYSGSKGGLLGCAVAALFAVVVAFPFLFLMAWGGAHCEPIPQCQRAGESRFAIIFAVIVALGALLGFSVKTIFNWRMNRAMGAAVSSHPPLWALLVVGVLVLVLTYSMLMPGGFLTLW
jgi:hypothetical protein